MVAMQIKGSGLNLWKLQADGLMDIFAHLIGNISSV